MAAVADRLSRAIPFNPFKPLDHHGFADCVASRRRAPAHLALLHRVNHAITQVLRIRLRHPCWPPPSRRLNQNATDSGIPTEL